jgi:glycosyltransferase involved in cell wall biosynthesis
LNTNSNSLVCILIPAVKRVNYLQESINSVFTQTFKDYGLTVIDDGLNTSESAKVSAKFQNVRYLYQNNHVSGAARNTGITLRKWDFTQLLDDDDRLEPPLTASCRGIFG